MRGETEVFLQWPCVDDDGLLWFAPLALIAGPRTRSHTGHPLPADAVHRGVPPATQREPLNPGWSSASIQRTRNQCLVHLKSQHEHEAVRLGRMLGDSLAVNRVHAIHARRVFRCQRHLAWPLDFAGCLSGAGLLAGVVDRGNHREPVGFGGVELSAISPRALLRITTVSLVSVSNLTLHHARYRIQGTPPSRAD